MLDKRSCVILLKIIEKDSPIVVKTLSQELNISERTIRYNLNKIDDWLKSNGLAPLNRIPGKGIFANQKQKKMIRDLLKNIDTYFYVNSTEERKKIIALKLLESSKPITINDLENELLVSKNTVLKELKVLREWFKERGVELVSKPRIGYFLEGMENMKRRAVKELMTEIFEKDMAVDIIRAINGRVKVDSGISKEIKSLFKDLDINYIEACVRYTEKLLEKEFTYESYVNLVTHIAIAIKRLRDNKEIKMSPCNLSKIKEFTEFEAAKSMAEKLEEKFNIKIPEDEIGYIAMHLVGTKVQKDLNNQYEKESISEIACDLINNFEKEFKIVLSDKSGLMKNLILHLRPAVYRMEFDIKIHNPLLNDIKNRFKRVFDTTKKIVKDIEKKYDISFNEDEIGYIAMHFGSALHLQSKFKGRKFNVLVVCGSGVGTAKLLEAQLKIKFPQINIVDTISSLDTDKYLNKNIDFLISTIDIESKFFKTIVVSPLLNTKDCRIIQNTLNITQIEDSSNNVEKVVSQIMNSISNHCKIENYEQLLNEIIYILKNKTQFINELEGGKPMLNELITEETIALNVEVKDWKDAVYKGAEMLLIKDYIDKSYIDGIIKNILEIGAYIVIAPGIALPHARPECGVKKLSMSLMTLKNPVEFGNEDNDPVKLVITLAAIDNEMHLKALSQLMGLLNNSEDVQAIFNAKNKKEILCIIEKYSK
ncbi:Transcriptional antiterminator [Caloranaerobacter azorensis DSM 13643]|uniref:Transcriptional antiterminator n=1 Tax=Caloranaerobacter azorensis DSM 13643 TaxID=1121264 RepID=A0A1M5VIE8_9FIRM|nr:BglG family transcription antiterminator [Caloranaerobacter azorensis]SHH74673.1 Transcriptional antiterminator [Caloranaerobacter azorensis DSM 13643]